MTYCIGMLLDEGVVLLADSRTNAGVDQISTFRKMTIFEKAGERAIVLLSSGNLAITQSLISMLQESIRANGERPSLMNVPNLFEAARHVGDALRVVFLRDADALKAFSIEFSAGFILGGQIAGEPPRLFNIYAAGNFIEATAETPYFQIGESKYGKPIIDRVLKRISSISHAVKCALISMDSTLRSNLSVGPPIDLLLYRRDSLQVGLRQRLEDDDPYLNRVRTYWNDSLRNALQNLPDPGWLQPFDAPPAAG